MKKLVCLLVAMILCLSCVAMASAAQSKTTANLTKTETVTKAPVVETAPVIELVVELVEENEELLATAQKEIEKLAASESVEAYFGEILDENGAAIDLKALLGVDVLNVHEFHPVVASGFTAESGDVTVKLLFPTPYEVGEKVAVMIGIVTVNEDETQTVAWKMFEGVGVEVEANQVEAQGAIEVVLDVETVLAIQEGTALLAVVSK